MKNNYFDSLTGLRAVAAILVFFHHCPIGFGSIPYISSLEHEMHIGVTIFYVLSGFLISFNYAEKSFSRWEEFVNFYLNRIFRLYPTYLLVFVVFGILVYEVNSENIFRNLFLYKALFDQYKFECNGQAWSIFVEFNFYFVFPLLILFIRKYNSAIKLYLICLLLSAVFFSIFNYFIDYNGLLQGKIFYLLYTFFGRFTEFLVGIATYYLYKNSLLKISNKTFWGTIGIILILNILAVLCLEYKTSYGLYTPLGLFLNNIILPIMVSMLLLGLVTEKTMLSDLLSSKLFIQLGLGSYCFYLIHIDIYNLFNHYFKVGFSTIYVFFILQVLSLIVHHYFEQPVNTFLRKRFNINLKESNE